MSSQSTDPRLVRRLEEQIALLDSAYISTLHSFCLRLVRDHFHDERLRLDPEFVVLAEEQVHQLRNNTLDALLEAHYGGKSEDARAFRKFLTEQVSGNETRVRDLIWQLHRYSRSLADPVAWFEKQLAMFADAEPRQWREWLQDRIWRMARALDARLAGVFRHAERRRLPESSRRREANAQRWKKSARRSAKSRRHIPQNGRAAAWAPCASKIEDFFSDAAFLQSLLPGANGEDPLKQDWEWSRGHMQTLLRLTREFGDAFDAAKREAGGVDFSDLEQFALRLLWDAQANRATPLARGMAGAFQIRVRG